MATIALNSKLIPPPHFINKLTTNIYMFQTGHLVKVHEKITLSKKYLKETGVKDLKKDRQKVS